MAKKEPPESQGLRRFAFSGETTGADLRCESPGVNHFRNSSLPLSRTAFSLVEVIVAIALVAITLAGLFAVQWQSSRIIVGLREYAAAARGVQERLETVRGVRWNRLSSAETLPQELLSEIPPGGETLLGLVEDVSISVYPEDSSRTPLQVRRSGAEANVISQNPTLAQERLLRVSVRLSWQAALGHRERVHEATAVLTRRSFAQ